MKAPSSSGGPARGNPSLCRSRADLVVLSDVVSSSGLDELEGLDGLALRLDRLLLLPGKAGIVAVRVGLLWASFLSGPLVSSYSLGSACLLECCGFVACCRVAPN